MTCNPLIAVNFSRQVNFNDNNSSSGQIIYQNRNVSSNSSNYSKYSQLNYAPNFIHKMINTNYNNFHPFEKLTIGSNIENYSNKIEKDNSVYLREEMNKNLNYSTKFYPAEQCKKDFAQMVPENVDQNHLIDRNNKNSRQNMLNYQAPNEMKSSNNLYNEEIFNSKIMNTTKIANCDNIYEKNEGKSKRNSMVNDLNLRKQNINPYYSSLEKIRSNRIGNIEGKKGFYQNNLELNSPKNNEIPNSDYENSQKEHKGENQKEKSQRKEIEQVGNSSKFSKNKVKENSNQNSCYKCRGNIVESKRCYSYFSKSKFRKDHESDCHYKGHQKEIKIIKIEKEWQKFAQINREI